MVRSSRTHPALQLLVLALLPLDEKATVGGIASTLIGSPPSASEYTMSTATGGCQRPIMQVPRGTLRWNERAREIVHAGTP